MSEFDEYIVHGELGQKEKAYAWQTAIRLQDVDRLKPSQFLLEQATAIIDDKISSEDIGKRLEEYYSQKPVQRKLTEHLKQIEWMSTIFPDTIPTALYTSAGMSHCDRMAFQKKINAIIV